MEEIWRPISGCEGYSVSSLGNVRNDTKMRELSMIPKKSHGYKVATISYGSFYVHRLVALAFIPNPKNKPQVNHKDGNKANNTVHNLEWSTPSENVLHSYEYGLNKAVKGANHHGHGRKMSDIKIKIINTETLEVFDSVCSAARSAKISHQCMRRSIKSGRNKVFKLIQEAPPL